jgi:rRNA pseudouridine-1189 N-methylase Emg1 (Nep1/Mra1 family)
MVGIFKDVLKKQHVPDRDQRELLEIIDSTKDGIITAGAR